MHIICIGLDTRDHDVVSTQLLIDKNNRKSGFLLANVKMSYRTVTAVVSSYRHRNINNMYFRNLDTTR